jgi:hypothetical protein
VLICVNGSVSAEHLLGSENEEIRAGAEIIEDNTLKMRVAERGAFSDLYASMGERAQMPLVYS